MKVFTIEWSAKVDEILSLFKKHHVAPKIMLMNTPYSLVNYTYLLRESFKFFKVLRWTINEFII